MCQAIQNGGRRCPQHQHAQQAVFNVIKTITILKDKQISTLFTSLRREALGRQRAASTERSNQVILDSIESSSLGEYNLQTLRRSTVERFEESEQAEEELDVRTRYARNLIVDRALTLSDNLQNALENIAATTGRPLDDVKNQFWEVYNNTDTTRNAEAPAAYTQTRRREYFNAGLPYDRSTINALETVRTPPQTPAEPILITQRRIPALTPPATRSHIRGLGYHEGRLEILFGSGTPYAYRNIPPALWEEISTSSSPGTVFSQRIRNNPEYQYASREESEADGYITNCQTCGQFVSSDGSHLCPVTENTLQTTIITETSNSNEVETTTTVPTPAQEPVILQEYERITATRTTPAGIKIYSIHNSEDSTQRKSLGSSINEENEQFFSRQILANDPRKLARTLETIRTINTVRESMVLTSVTVLDNEIQRFNRLRAITSHSKTPRYFNSRVRNQDLEVPIEISFSTTAQAVPLGLSGEHSDAMLPETRNVFVEPGTVTGSVHYKKVPQNSIFSDSNLRPLNREVRTLKCDCSAYVRQGYTCEHIRTALDAAAAGLFDRATIRQDYNEAPPTGEGDRYYSSSLGITAPLNMDDNPSALTHAVAAYISNPTYRTRLHSTSILNDPENATNRRVAATAEANNLPIHAAFARSNRGNLYLPADVRALINTNPISQPSSRSRRTQNGAGPHITQRRSTSGGLSAAVEQSLREAQDRHTEKMREVRLNNPPTFTSNPSEFANLVATVRRKRGRKMERIPFVADSEPGEITGGICAPEEGARKFGVELEFSLDSLDHHDRNEALRQIGRELHDAGLTNSPAQAGYHSGARSGWANWSFEYDGTVDGEIVSPVMSDTPESWAQIRKVCEIIKSNGGETDTRTGSHVHISTGSYAHSTEKYTNIAKSITSHKSLLYAIGKNHDRGSHRGTTWCSPNLIDGSGELRYPSSNTHTAAVNFGGANSSRANRRNAHTEFRFWDATLEPAIIQQQVAISAAIADYADITQERLAATDKPFRASAFTNQVPERFTPSDTHQTSISFLDNVLPTKKMRQRAAELFGIV